MAECNLVAQWGYSIFQVTGMTEWGQNSKPKKISRAPKFQQNPKKTLDQKLTHKKSHAEFLVVKNLQKGKQIWLNFNGRTMWLGYAGSTTNLQIVLNSPPKNSYLNQATQKSTCHIFPTQKNAGIETFKPKKILPSSLSHEIWSNPSNPTPPPPPPALVASRQLTINFKGYFEKS